MRYRALKSFGGVISMKANEVRELPCGEVLSELIRCGYVEAAADKEVRNEAKRSKAVGRKACNKS